MKNIAIEIKHSMDRRNTRVGTDEKTKKNELEDGSD